jgi:hypothetical protein
VPTSPTTTGCEDAAENRGKTVTRHSVSHIQYITFDTSSVLYSGQRSIPFPRMMRNLEAFGHPLLIAIQPGPSIRSARNGCAEQQVRTAPMAFRRCHAFCKMKNAKGAKVDAPKDTRRFRCHIRKMASTVKQITLTPPTAPPIIGPRGKDVLLGATAGVVG